MTEPSQYFKGRTVQEQMDEVIGYVDVRSAEVATTAIASDVAQVHQDMLDADADAQAAAASAAAAAGTLANAVKKTGEASQSIAGDIAVVGDLSAGGNLSVTGNLGVSGTATVPTPANNTDAANKKYVDDADALKISIADVNNYAVGLTGNQTPILGEKDFNNLKLSGAFDNKSVGVGANALGYARFYHGTNSSSTGISIVVLFVNGKGFSDTDMNKSSIVQFGVRPSIASAKIGFLSKGSAIGAGEYAVTFDANGCPDIWVKILSGASNHGVTATKLTEVGNTAPTDFFEVGDKTFYAEADFQTEYPTAIYSS